MTKENAKQFLPLVQALADGKTIQRLIDSEWEDQCYVEFTGATSHFRIKPEPRRFWVNEYPGKDIASSSILHKTKVSADENADDTRIACFEVVEVL